MATPQTELEFRIAPHSVRDLVARAQRKLELITIESAPNIPDDVDVWDWVNYDQADIAYEELTDIITILQQAQLKIYTKSRRHADKKEE